MKLVLSGVLAVATSGTVVLAQEVKLSSGAAVVSEHVSNGIRYSDGAALQPSIELGFGGADNVGFGLAYHDTDVSPDLRLLDSDGLIVAILTLDVSLG